MEKDDDPATIQLLHFLLRNEHSKWGNVDGAYWTVNTTITVLSCVKSHWQWDGVGVEALRYKPEVRGFYSRWCHWNFSFNINLPIVLWTWGWLSLPCRELFIELKILTFPSLCIYQLIMFVNKNSEFYITNYSIHNYNTRMKKNLH